MTAITKMSREQYWEINKDGEEAAENWASQQTDPNMLLEYHSVFYDLLGELGTELDRLDISICRDGFDYWRFWAVATKENFEYTMARFKDVESFEYDDLEDVTEGNEAEGFCYIGYDRFEELTGKEWHDTFYEYYEARNKE